MNEFARRQCLMILRQIDAFRANSQSFQKTMRNLKGLAAQLYESNPELSRALLREWGVLEEINAYVLDRKLPAVPPEYEVLADEALSRMSDLVVETLESDIGQKYNSE